MTWTSYVGDAVTAAAMSLVGVRSFTPEPDAGEIWRAVLEARRQSALVIIDQDCADQVQEKLNEVVAEYPLPPMVVMPTLDRDDPPESGASHDARRVLGLEQKDHS